MPKLKKKNSASPSEWYRQIWLLNKYVTPQKTNRIIKRLSLGLCVGLTIYVIFQDQVAHFAETNVRSVAMGQENVVASEEEFLHFSRSPNNIVSTPVSEPMLLFRYCSAVGVAVAASTGLLALCLKSQAIECGLEEADVEAARHEIEVSPSRPASNHCRKQRIA